MEVKRKYIILLLTFVLFTAGCKHANSSTNTTAEAVPQTETTFAAETTVTEETQPNAGHDQAYQWMIHLKAEDVAFVEFLNLNDPGFPYRRYEENEIQEVIDLLQAKDCLQYEPICEYAPIVQWPGYYSKEFHVVMKDGTAHTVCSVYSTITVIDGTGYQTISAWLNNHWPESGNAPLPEHWAQEAASRNYHVADVTSTLSTASFENDRFHLDQSYDTDIGFGSRSRNYPIGRGGVELSAAEPSKAGVSLRAFWASTGSPTQIRLQPQYWLEKWQDEAGCYVALDGGQFRSEVPQLLPEAARYWYVSWENACGLLEPGHYRVGMTFYEEYNGSIQNETICYAKFSLS